MLCRPPAKVGNLSEMAEVVRGSIARRTVYDEVGVCVLLVRRAEPCPGTVMGGIYRGDSFRQHGSPRQ